MKIWCKCIGVSRLVFGQTWISCCQSFWTKNKCALILCSLWSPGVPLTCLRALCCYYLIVYMCPSYADHSCDSYSYDCALPPSWLTQTNTRAEIPYPRRGRSCDPVIRWSGDPLIRWSGDPSICRSCVLLFECVVCSWLSILIVMCWSDCVVNVMILRVLPVFRLVVLTSFVCCALYVHRCLTYYIFALSCFSCFFVVRIWGYASLDVSQLVFVLVWNSLILWFRDPATRWSGEPVIMCACDLVIRWSGGPMIRLFGDPLIWWSLFCCGCYLLCLLLCVMLLCLLLWPVCIVLCFPRVACLFVVLCMLVFCCFPLVRWSGDSVIRCSVICCPVDPVIRWSATRWPGDTVIRWSGDHIQNWSWVVYLSAWKTGWCAVLSANIADFSKPGEDTQLYSNILSE